MLLAMGTGRMHRYRSGRESKRVDYQAGTEETYAHRCPCRGFSLLCGPAYGLNSTVRISVPFVHCQVDSCWHCQGDGRDRAGHARVPTASPLAPAYSGCPENKDPSGRARHGQACPQTEIMMKLQMTWVNLPKYVARRARIAGRAKSTRSQIHPISYIILENIG